MLKFLLERSIFMTIGLLTIVDGLVLLLSFGCYQAHFAHFYGSWVTRRRFQREFAARSKKGTWPQAQPSEEALQRAKRVKKAL